MNNVSEYTCFIASPGDTREERESCEEVFNEINNGIGRSLGFRLSTLRWENDVYSSIADYGQDVINKQIDTKYDLFLGIMKSRFGTPTPVAGSGTEEEFNNAFEKWKSGEIDNIFFFFGNTQKSLNDIDPDQLKQVRVFKERILKQGVVPMEYVDLEDFKRQLKRNIENYFIDNKPRKRKGAKQDSKALIKAKVVSYDHRKLWETAISLLYKNATTQQIYTKLTKSKNRFHKVIFPQEHVISHLMTKEPLTEAKAKLFALAVSDIGQIPSYYNNYHKDDIELNKLSIWIQLKERENTLRGLDLKLNVVDNASNYEQLQRYLFHLDFSKSKELVCKWNATGFWVQSKAMRMAVYPELRESATNLLKKTIAKEQNPSEKLFEVILANFISHSSTPYSTEEFWRYGIDGQGDLLNSMMSSLRGKEEKPQRRNWIGTTHYFGDGHGDYCKSLRILQFIIDSGIYLSLPGTYMFEISAWYRVFTNLYEYFPYPCFFYSIQYNDKDVQRRIGEEFAYNEGLQDFVQDILLKSLSAISNPDTPESFKKGILNVTAAMYVAVEEDLWYDIFIKTVFEVFRKELNSKNKELINNTKFAIGSLKKADNIKKILFELLDLYSLNENIVSDIIVENLMVDRLSSHCIDDINIQIKNYLSSDTIELLDKLNNANLLSNSIRKELVLAVRHSNEENLPKNRVPLCLLANLVCEDSSAIEKIKQRCLSLDIWHCGVLNNNEFGWTEPQYILLPLLNDKITWTDEEFDIIKQNLIKNVATYNKNHKRLHEDSFMKSTQVKYLSNILKYINGLNDERKSMLDDIRRDVDSLLKDRTNYEDNIDSMMSDQSADVDYAFGNIYESVLARGVDLCKHDIDFLIDRAIMKHPIALTRNLRCIKFIMDKKSEEMLQAGYDKKLNKLLSVYMDTSSWQSLDLRFAFNYLHSIAKSLNEKNLISKDCAQFWLSNTFVKKFVLD